MSTKIDKSYLMKWIVTFAVPLLIWLIPTNEVFSSDLRLFLVITVFVILMVAFEFFNLSCHAITVVIYYDRFGYNSGCI